MRPSNIALSRRVSFAAVSGRAAGRRHQQQRAMASSGAAGDGAAAARPPNLLAQEKSPYLLQHAHNEVQWLPWGREAFERARAESKPVFLSVGYGTCHWCHVMAHESFEHGEAAALLNAHFIPVKVDREERPDVDRVYMEYVQALTGSGGWPMSVFLTPALRPIYGATYMPPVDRPGMPSFATVLRRVANVWATRRADLEAQAEETLRQLRAMSEPPPLPAQAPGAAGAALPLDLLAAAPLAAGAALLARLDAARGGFGAAPKFPRPSELNACLTGAAAARLKGDNEQAAALAGAALRSLQAYAAGGMYDHLGGGWHRYSVDNYLHVPHFEKMLYDNPQLVCSCLDALAYGAAAAAAASAAAGGGSAGAAAAAAPAGEQASGGGGGSVAAWAVPAVRGTLDYLLRPPMAHPDGGIFSAEDADSKDPATGEPREGAFYVWTRADAEAALAAATDPPLPPGAAEMLLEAYDVRSGGNADRDPMSDPHGEFAGKNVLIQVKPAAGTAAAAAAGLAGGDLEAAEAALAAAREALFRARELRPRPALDDKIVTAWNGQAIAALARAATTLAHLDGPAAPPRRWPSEGRAAREYFDAALRCARFARQNSWDENAKRLKRAWCKGGAGEVQGFAADYSYLVDGLIALAEAGGGHEWLAWAAELQGVLDAEFWNAERGGWTDAAPGADAELDALGLLKIEDYDGAEPAAGSVAVANLVRLASLLPADGSSGGGGEGSSSSSGDAAAGAAAAERYLARADAALAAGRARLQAPAALAAPQLCVSAWLRARAPLRQVIVTGAAGDARREALLAAAGAAWPRDFAVLAIDTADAAAAAFWRARNPRAWVMAAAHAEKHASSGGGGAPPTAFVCQDYTCRAPTTDPARLLALLQEAGAPPKTPPLSGAAGLSASAWPPPRVD